jgi:predicted GNAT superfamily acetyltransferase
MARLLWPIQPGAQPMKEISLRVLETQQELKQVEELQLRVWFGSELDVVPANLLMAAVHNGGLVIGAYETNQADIEISDQDSSKKHDQPEDSWKEVPELVGFVFGFPGIYPSPEGMQIKHHSHMLGVLPAYRDKGIGFLLKRAQWQMVRHQNLDRITWTYDPLQSRNAHLSIARLGAVCNTYFQDFYGEMRDGINQGIPSDRFQVDWWVNSKRVMRRLSKRPRKKLDLAHFLAAETQLINPSRIDHNHYPQPGFEEDVLAALNQNLQNEQPLLLVEIPADFLALKEVSLELAFEWRSHSRWLFQKLFEKGYLITDFVHLPGKYSRSFYVMSHGESTL